MASAKSSIILFLLLVPLVSASVEKICREIIAVKGLKVNYGFCVRILKTYPGSAAADEGGIAVIAGKLGAAEARQAIMKAVALSNNTNIDVNETLKKCVMLYGAAMEELMAAGEAAEARSFLEASYRFMLAMSVPAKCDVEFKKKKLRSPLMKDGCKLAEICAIGVAVTQKRPLFSAPPVASPPTP